MNLVVLDVGSNENWVAEPKDAMIVKVNQYTVYPNESMVVIELADKRKINVPICQCDFGTQGIILRSIDLPTEGFAALKEKIDV